MKNKLTVTTPSDRELLVTRTFDAPRALVWEAMTTPDLLQRWVTGPPGWVMTTCEDDQRAGGSFRWAWSGPAGEQMVMSGEYREVAAPERCVRTERFEIVGGPPMGEQLATLVLTEQGGKTTLTITLLYASKEARDGAAASGMEHGMAAGYDRLEDVLAAK